MNVIEVKYNTHFKYYEILLENNGELIGVDLFSSIWKTLIDLSEWNNFETKIIIMEIYNTETNESYYIHKNIVIDKNTTFQMYYDSIKNIVANYTSRYQSVEFDQVKIKIWPMILSNSKYILNEKPVVRKFHTQIDRNKIGELKPLAKCGKKGLGILCALDVETISINNVQIPIAISFAYRFKNRLNSFVMMIDYNLLLENKELAIQNLWNDLFDKLKSLQISNELFIYSHNLGGFDGYFLLPALYKYVGDRYKSVNPLIDDHNKFISINYYYTEQKYLNLSEEEMVDKGLTDENRYDKSTYNWKFVDSYRLFPISLNNFCKNFNVEGKLSNYNPDWNSIDLFNNSDELEKFKKYSIQDSIALLNALLNARSIYLEKYNVDIVKTVSAPSLSLLIYRHKFQKVNIPIFNRKLDGIIRESYYGGSSDYFKFYGENLKYYDVNSLYPYAMLNDMPLDYLGEFYPDLLPFDQIFGFVDVIVTAPDNIKIPLLLCRHNGKVIHPIGTWKGTYFSDEIKAVIKYGYKVKILKIYQFSKQKIFSEYIDHFYLSKKEAIDPSTRFIAKMHLNSLYGMFGRKPNTLRTVPAVSSSDVINIINKYPVKKMIDITDNLKLLLIHNNLDFDVIKKLKTELSPTLYQQTQSKVKANIAIASAVTAYARIEMMKYKTLDDINVYYSDTDSIFVDKPLPDHLIGKELGQMKDELGGGLIEKAYFFGIKKYAYIDNKAVVKSVFSGIPRNNLSWDDIEKIASKENLITPIPDQFFKSLQRMEV